MSQTADRYVHLVANKIDVKKHNKIPYDLSYCRKIYSKFIEKTVIYSP